MVPLGHNELTSVRPWETYLNELLFEMQILSFKNVHLKMPSARCQPFCSGLNVLNGSSNPGHRHCLPLWPPAVQECDDSSSLNALTPEQNGRHFADGIFSCILLKENIERKYWYFDWNFTEICLKFSCKSVCWRIMLVASYCNYDNGSD